MRPARPARTTLVQDLFAESSLKLVSAVVKCFWRVGASGCDLVDQFATQLAGKIKGMPSHDKG